MDSKALQKQRELLLEFIQVYKEQACLWDRRHPAYSVRGARRAAQQRLLRQYRAIDARATLHTVKSRLDIIRCGYIRELKKVRLSREMSSDPSKHYIPRLWYYDSCSFLEGQYMPGKEAKEASASKQHYDVTEETVYINTYDDMEAEYLEESSSSSVDDEPPVKRKKQGVVLAENSEESHTKYSDDDLECIGRVVALQMRDLDPYQLAIAHKLVSETLFYAKMGKLTVDSHVVTCLKENDDTEYS